MYSSPFSVNSIKSVTRAGDAGRYGVDVSGELETIAADTLSGVVSETLDFTFRKVLTRANRELYLLDDYKTVLALRAAAKEIAAQYKIRPLGRDAIVRGFLESLFDATPCNIIRCDFSSFYENIDIGPAISEFRKNTRTHPHVKSILASLETNGILDPTTPGIPRGLGLSAVLSELRLKKFDSDVRNLPGVYRYFRFADDFVIFSLREQSQTMLDVNKLVGTDLSFNSTKTNFHNISSNNDTATKPCEIAPVEINFLGYKFIISVGIRAKKSRTVRVTFSDNKLAKRKTRLILSLKEFKKSKNSELLLRRIQLLSSNMSLRRSGHNVGSSSVRVKTGVYYNYPACGTYNCIGNRPVRERGAAVPELKHLDGFLFSLLWRKGSDFCSDIKANLSKSDRIELKKFSFNKGYSEKMTIRMTRTKAAEARKVWRHA